MSTIPGPTQAAQNPKAVLLTGEDTTNSVFRHVAVDATGQLMVAPGGGTQDVDIVGQSVGNLDVDVQNFPAVQTVEPDKAAAVATEGVVAVGLVSAPLLASNASRKGALTTNNGGGFCFVALGGTAVDGQAAGGTSSHRLNNGGTLFLDSYTGAISAIRNSAGTSFVGVSEW